MSEQDKRELEGAFRRMVSASPILQRMVAMIDPETFDQIVTSVVQGKGLLDEVKEPPK